jgi:hypothetical protein
MTVPRAAWEGAHIRSLVLSKPATPIYMSAENKQESNWGNLWFPSRPICALPGRSGLGTISSTKRSLLQLDGTICHWSAMARDLRPIAIDYAAGVIDLTQS